MKRLKKLIFIIAIILALPMSALLAACNSETDEPTPAENGVEDIVEEDEAVVLTKDIETRAIEQANEFSYNLFTTINDDIKNLDEKNNFISPLSVSITMSMLANGASGETRDEIIKALGYNGITTIDGINQVNAKLLETLPNADPKVKFTIANALWINNQFPIKDEFTGKLAEIYNATIDNLDFSKGESLETINTWASNSTNGLIKKILNSLSSDSPLVLANALYFIGDWQNETFSTIKKYTFNNPDGKKSVVEGMSELNNILYNCNDKCQIATFKLGSGNYSYTAILPNTDVTISDAVASVSDEFINESTQRFVSFSTPKFNIKNSLSIKDYLAALGIKRIFDKDADFSKLADGNLFVDQVDHHTNIMLDENGIEAAAITDVFWVTSTGEELPEYITFSIDRPFAFLIREETTGAIIFIGAVNQL